MKEYSKAWVLKELILLNGFATSASALAKELGYTGKTHFYRILNEEAGSGTVEEVWKRIREKYNLSDDDIICYTEAIYNARYLWKKSGEKAQESGDSQDWVAQSLLQALLDMDEKAARKILSGEEWIQISDIRRDLPQEFAQILVLFYIQIKNIDRAYKGKAEEVRPLLINGLLDYLTKLSPEYQAIQEIAETYLSSPYPSSVCNLWVNIQFPVSMVQFFFDPEYRAKAVNSLYFLPVSSPSLWMTYEGLRSKATTAILMNETHPEGITGGRYECLEIEANISDFSFKPIRQFAFSFMRPEDEDEADFAFMFSRDENGDFISETFGYIYDKLGQTLYLKSAKDGVLPSELHYVNPDHSLLKEEHDWRIWLKDYLKENDEKIFLEVMKSYGMTLVEGYIIEDVAMSRRYLTISIFDGQKSSDYRIDLELHPGLRQVSPTMKVFLIRHQRDGKVYIEWFNPHIVIAMEEFCKVN